MARRFPQYLVNILLLSTFLQISEIRCLRRLPRRKLSAEADDIRSILSSALDAKPSLMIENNKKRDTSVEDLASADSQQAEDSVASESKDTSVYDDDVDEDYLDQQRNLENSEHKRNVEAEAAVEKSENRGDTDAAYEETDDLHDVKDVDKRDADNDDDYNEDLNADASVSSDSEVVQVKARSINSKNIENLKMEKRDNQRAANVEEFNSELDFEKQIEDQIQQRIDSIKEDIKREIERKQQIREIEANNAKYDELELSRDDDEAENQPVVGSVTLDSSKRSISRDKDEVEKLAQSVRSKRSDIALGNVQVDDDKGSGSSKRSISRNASQLSEFRSRRSDLNVASNENKQGNKESAMILPVKKRSLERQVTLVEKSNVRDGKRKERSSILIPERGHAEVKDELPGDFTLGSNLQIAGSDPTNPAASQVSRSARSVINHQDQPKRYRRDMGDEVENEEGTMQDSFLFAAREKPDCRTRRRRGRERKKAQKHPRRSSRRHRAVRESSMDDEEMDEERDKRGMSLDEDIALEYKESFGGLQADTGGALGRFKRIRRSSKIS